jgi:hypothetical protein
MFSGKGVPRGKRFKKKRGTTRFGMSKSEVGSERKKENSEETKANLSF